MKLCIVAVFALALTGCPSPAKGPETTRAHVRGAVLTMADAVELADRLCATAVHELKAEGKAYGLVASKCIDGYALARAALIDAEDALDVLDEVGSSDAAMSKIGCAVGSVAGGLSVTASALKQAGVPMPAKVEDALSLAHWLGQAVGGSCAYRKAYEDADVGGDASAVLAPADAGPEGG